MPTVQIDGPAIDVAQKRALVKSITNIIAETYNIPNATILIRENATDNVGINGKLISDLAPLDPKAEEVGKKYLSPAKILRYITGAWATSILASAIEFDVFEHLNNGDHGTEAIAQSCRISSRGAQVLLDGLLGLNLIELKDTGYALSPDAKCFLLKGGDAYFGNFAKTGLQLMRNWTTLPEAVESGKPVRRVDVENDAFWMDMVHSIQPVTIAGAIQSAKKLKIQDHQTFHMLDIGGGKGSYSAVWLRANERARSTQIDRPAVNAIAKDYLKNFGLLDRFETLNGNIETTDFGEDLYDFVIFSHIAHGLSPEKNMTFFSRIKKTLKHNGILVLTDFILDEKRNGHPMELLFNGNMLLSTLDGATYTKNEYERWLKKAGFTHLEFQSLSPQPGTILYAK